MHNMKSLKIVLGLSLIMISKSNALETLQIKDQGQIDALISSKDHTRLAVKGDRIAQIFGVDERLNVDLDETNGQIFLRPMPGLENSNFFITIVTEKGITQDLRLKANKKEAEAILLNPEKQILKEPSIQKLESYDDQIIALIRGFSGAEVPKNYYIKRLKDGEKREVTSSIKMTSLATINGAKFHATLYRLENFGEEKHALTEKLFLDFGNVAIGLSKATLAPKETAFLYAISHARGKDE